MSLTESEFLPSLMTCQLDAHDYKCRLSHGCCLEQSSPPQLILHCIKQPRWLKSNTGGRRQLLPSPLSALILFAAQPQCLKQAWDGTQSRAGLNAGEEMNHSSWEWNSSCVPFCESSSCGRACTAWKMVSLLKHCYFLIVMEKYNKISWTYFFQPWEETLCNLCHPGNLSLFAVLNHQPNQYCSKTAVWWCYSSCYISIFHFSIDKGIFHTNTTVAVLHRYSYHDK